MKILTTFRSVAYTIYSSTITVDYNHKDISIYTAMANEKNYNETYLNTLDGLSEEEVINRLMELESLHTNESLEIFLKTKTGE